jgi:hypothetical protein
MTFLFVLGCGLIGCATLFAVLAWFAPEGEDDR